MNYTPKEILSFVEKNDVKFIILTFTDIYGNLKNIAIMPGELPKAFEKGLPFDSYFFSEEYPDLILVPDTSTMSVVPCQQKSGKAISFFCNIKCTDGTNYSGDMRNELSSFIKEINEKNYNCKISTKCEFYLFDTDENGNPTKIPHDNAGYLDTAPFDRCENVRREICLALEEMGFNPKSSCHTYGPGQNQIEFKSSDPLNCADNMVYYKTTVKNIAAQNGLFASFMPKPMDDQFGSGFHIGISVEENGNHILSGTETGKQFIAGILCRIKEITCFLNPITNSYKRLGKHFAPSFINGCFEKPSSLIRFPHTDGSLQKILIRSADSACNPYIAFKLLLKAGFEGIENGISFDEITKKSDRLPDSLEQAAAIAKSSEFVKENLSEEIYKSMFKYFDNMLTRYNLFDKKTDFEEEFYFNMI